jgi:hypothetical protein
MDIFVFDFLGEEAEFLCTEPGEPLVIDVDSQRVHAGYEHVDSQVEFVTVD